MREKRPEHKEEKKEKPIEIEEEPKWKTEFENFDKEQSEVWSKLFIKEERDTLIEKAIQETIKENPGKKFPVEEAQSAEITKYEGVTYKTEIDGFPVTICDIEESIRTPEYLARQGRLSADEVRKQWKGKEKIVCYGGDIEISITDVDEKRKIVIQHQDNYGKFIKIKADNQKIYHGVKFDLEMERKHTAERRLYNFIEEMIEISKECGDIGVEAKQIGRGVSGDTERLVLTLGHIYPRFKKGLTNNETREKLQKFYKVAKKQWGSTFKPNIVDKRSSNTIKELGLDFS